MRLRLALTIAALIPVLALAQPPDRKGLDTASGVANVAANAAYAAATLTVECWARLDQRASYNIIIAHELKSSATHWELFTEPSSGLFTVYMPGRSPDHIRSNTDIADGKWHHLAAVFEPARVRLYVDGAGKASLETTTPDPAKRVPGGMSFGQLIDSGIRSKGIVDEVRLSRVAREITSVPDADFTPDADTVGLWHLDAPVEGKYPDASALANPAAYVPMPLDLGPGHIPIAGGMSNAFIALPPAEDAAPLREALAQEAQRLSLKTVDAAAIRDAVLREWSYDFAWIGKLEYPESRQPWVQDPEAVKREAFDANALIWETDGGPAGTVLRRTSALIGNLTDQGCGDAIAPFVADFHRVKAAFEAEKPAPDSPAHKALYLAACAVRRQIALSNPVLDFDSLLFVARGTFAGSVRSNPGTGDVQGGHFATQYYGFNALPGGGLYVLRDIKGNPEVVNVVADSVVQNGRLKGQKLDHGAFATPDLSPDGKTIAFAWSGNTDHQWIWSRDRVLHVFTVNVDGTNLRQITDGPYDDFDPCWLPNGRLAFLSERRGGHIRCFGAYLKVRQFTLFSMLPDGSDITPLSYFETDEWNPSVNNDGKLVFTRWDYTDRENCIGTRFWISGLDGQDPRSPHGNYPYPWHTFPDHDVWDRFPDGREMDSRMRSPLVEMGIRQVPDSHRYIATAAPHHGEAYGSLIMLDLRVEDDHHMSQVKRITPEEPFPESENSGRRHYKYGAPWPLSEDFYLCTVWENLCLVDRYGNKELLCDLRSLPCVPDERLRCVDPIPLRPIAWRRLSETPVGQVTRPVPAVAVSPSQTVREDGRPQAPQTRVSTRGEGGAAVASPATISLFNVYDSDLPFPEGTKVKWLRIVQNFLKANHTIGEPMIGYERENTPRVPLGVVPVEDDGSAYFEAPVAKELIFQALDEDFRAVQSMRAVAYAHPGENLTCQGCHEPTNKAPRAGRRPLATQRAPSRLQPECGQVEPVSYYRTVKPIFDNTCVTCHKAQSKGPQDMSYEALREDTFWFAGAMYLDMTTAYSGIHGGSRTIPGRFGARNCRLGRALMTDAHKAAVPPDQRHKVIQWLDCNSLRLGSYLREDAQLRGELVWPELDTDPENPVGVEGRGKPLLGNFWHENLYGPHAFLGTSHAKQLIYIMDEQGQMVWSYAAQNPQDVWMLPSGNILMTWLHGVKEITRAGEVLWQYTVEAPNEVPTCQPLPDGNILVGIVGQCRLIELNRKGEIVHEIRLSTTVTEPHAQFRMCRKTPQGTYLVPFTAEGAVREFDRDGKLIHAFPKRPFPVCALRLDSGNTLISVDGTVAEYAPDDRIVWELNCDDVPDINIAIPAGVQRLPNGNTIICNWNTADTPTQDGAHIFEVTPDKRVVWQVTGTHIGQVAQCQLLTQDLMPRTDAIVR